MALRSDGAQIRSDLFIKEALEANKKEKLSLVHSALMEFKHLNSKSGPERPRKRMLDVESKTFNGV